AGGGALMNDRQVGDINRQLAETRAHADDIAARLARIDAVRQAYQEEQPPPSAVDETITEATNNTIINSLRTRYLDLINREVDWSARYGKNHTAVVNLRNQIREIRKSIRDELGRIGESAKSELEIAKRRQ